MSSLDREPPSSASLRTLFSTMMTELSTMSPKSIAPRLMRLAAMPTWSMPLKAKSIDSGIASATMRPARRLPRKTNSTATTRIAPTERFSWTVLMTWSTSSVRS